MNISEYAVRVAPDQQLYQALAEYQYGTVTAYMDTADFYEPGSVLLVPTYRLEEVEEIIEPEKPGVPVEPYVGMVIPYFNNKGHYVVCGELCGSWRVVLFSSEENQLELDTYRHPEHAIMEWPHTPSTPAVTFRVKKWVKIEHPEARL